jgi:DNA repair protein RadC
MATYDDKARPHKVLGGPPQWTQKGILPPPLRPNDEATDFDTLVEIISRRIRCAEKAVGLAFALLDRYAHLAGILSATEESLRGEFSVPEKLIQDLKRYHLVAMKFYRRPIESGPVFTSSAALHAYLYARMAHLSIEHIRILFLDNRQRLIRDELQQTGTPNHVPLQTSEIVKKALLFDSRKLIIVHNHPSGDSTPSPDDISFTERLNITANMMGIELVDHLIIGRAGSVSMKLLGHL